MKWTCISISLLLAAVGCSDRAPTAIVHKVGEIKANPLEREGRSDRPKGKALSLYALPVINSSYYVWLRLWYSFIVNLLSLGRDQKFTQTVVKVKPW